LCASEAPCLCLGLDEMSRYVFDERAEQALRTLEWMLDERDVSRGTGRTTLVAAAMRWMVFPERTPKTLTALIAPEGVELAAKRMPDVMDSWLQAHRQRWNKA